MEFVEVTLNPLMAEFETDAISADIDGERKVRRYWTPKEEERFYEIWGRENWRLTRYGKNTVFFAKWAVELSEQWGIDVKPEEIQAKVNQAKTKYRQVMKCMEVENTNVTKWKKFEIIDKILHNEHRPKDAEPISPEALEKSQDFSSVLASTALTMHQTAAAKATPAPNDEADFALQENSLHISLEDVNASETECVHTNTLFNSNDSHSQYSGELFIDRIDEIKREEFQEEFSSYANSSLYHQTRQPQLTPLQTPQQRQQMTQLQNPQQLKYQQQQQQYKTQTQSTAPTSHPHQQLQQHIQQLQQEIQQQQQHDHRTQQQQTQQLQTYDHTLNSYTISTTSSNNSRSLLVNNHNQNAPNATPSVRPAVHSSTSNQYANNYVVASKNASTEANANHTSGSSNINNNTNNTTNTNTNSNNNSNNNSMQPPRTNAVVSTVISPTQSRKRRSSAVHGAAAALHAAADSLEVLYLAEVRKKNLILDEQKEISRKRLYLEERKIALMEQFFPKCLELQEQILQKLNSA